MNPASVLWRDPYDAQFANVRQDIANVRNELKPSVLLAPRISDWAEKDEQQSAKRQRILELRASGLSLRAIADQMGISHSGVQKVLLHEG